MEKKNYDCNSEKKKNGQSSYFILQKDTLKSVKT